MTEMYSCCVAAMVLAIAIITCGFDGFSSGHPPRRVSPLPEELAHQAALELNKNMNIFLYCVFSNI